MYSDHCSPRRNLIACLKPSGSAKGSSLTQIRSVYTDDPPTRKGWDGFDQPDRFRKWVVLHRQERHNIDGVNGILLSLVPSQTNKLEHYMTYPVGKVNTYDHEGSSIVLM